ncbi:MAG: DUF6920 family protein [Longimicrobiales bacterium]
MRFRSFWVRRGSWCATGAAKLLDRGETRLGARGFGGITTALQSQGVRWEPIDENSAAATLMDVKTSVTLPSEFDERARIHTVRSDGRYRMVDGEIVATPWRGRFWSYELRGGMLIPLRGKVEWLFPDGPAPYWRGTIEEIDFEFAD